MFPDQFFFRTPKPCLLRRILFYFYTSFLSFQGSSNILLLGVLQINTNVKKACAEDSMMLTPIALTNTLTLRHLVPSLHKPTKHYFKFIKSHRAPFRAECHSVSTRGKPLGIFLPKPPEACRERPPPFTPSS